MRELSGKYRGRNELFLTLNIVLPLVLGVYIGLRTKSLVNLLLCLIGGSILLLIIFSILRKLLVNDDDKAIIEENKRGKKFYYQIIHNNDSLMNVKYLSGVSGCVNAMLGSLVIENDYLVFYVRESDEKYFELEIGSFTNLVHGNAKDISVGNVLMFGMLGIALSSNKYYLIIEYLSNNIENQLVIESKNSRNIIFLNKLNTIRNQKEAI